LTEQSLPVVLVTPDDRSQMMAATDWMPESSAAVHALYTQHNQLRPASPFWFWWRKGPG